MEGMASADWRFPRVMSDRHQHLLLIAPSAPNHVCAIFAALFIKPQNIYEETRGVVGGGMGPANVLKQRLRRARLRRR